jgi:pimeloyl-ACP methyl ester carboxylesterase
MLPLEYSPHHSYPLLIALRSRGRTNDELLHWWGGEAEKPGPSLKRGYIVIAPEYTDEKQAEYTYSVTAHQTVIDSLRDARRRFNVDADRVFLAGHGMGADAAFDLGMSHPDEFAGVIPIGGDCKLYPKITYENGRYTSWYVVGRGFGNDVAEGTSYGMFDDIFKRGARFDFMLVTYLGRGLDGYVEEIPKVFDWMDLHRRAAPPQKFQMDSLRKTDNRFFWLTAVDLPRTTILPLPPGVGKGVNKMSIDAGASVGNIVTFESATEKFVVRFLPNLVDFDKRVVVRSRGRQKFNGFITPDSKAILEELRTTGDRSRLPLATQQF